MQEMLLSALVAYQLNQGLEARVTTSPHRSYILHQYQRRSETSKPQEPRVYNARQLQMSSFNQSQIPERDQGTLPNKVRKTLVIAPHPDDEIICCGTLMSERVKNGEKVQVIYLTDGDALSTRDSDISKRYGKGRRKESIKAMAEIGVDESYLAFLNFPDGYLDVLDDEILTSAYTGQNSSKTATHFNHTVYRRSDLERNLRRLIRGAGADEI
ncbi:MAG TPA: PIG-L family deacetylase, partial [Candidatus Gracilibacteria bacterium]